MEKRLDFKTSQTGRVQLSTRSLAQGNSNIMGVSIHPTQTLVIPNTPRPTAGSIEGLAVPMRKNVVALGLFPFLLASPLESEIVA